MERLAQALKEKLNLSLQAWQSFVFGGNLKKCSDSKLISAQFFSQSTKEKPHKVLL